MAGIVVQPRRGYIRECDGPTPPSLPCSSISLKSPPTMTPGGWELQPLQKSCVVDPDGQAGWQGIAAPDSPLPPGRGSYLVIPDPIDDNFILERDREGRFAMLAGTWALGQPTTPLCRQAPGTATRSTHDWARSETRGASSAATEKA
jgi:hypothetical protein